MPLLISMIYASIHHCLLLQEYILSKSPLQNYTKDLLLEIDRRLGCAEKDELYIVATVLHPNFKLDLFANGSSQSVRDMLLKIMNSLYSSAWRFLSLQFL